MTRSCSVAAPPPNWVLRTSISPAILAGQLAAAHACVSTHEHWCAALRGWPWLQLEQLLGNRVELHEGRAFVDRADLGIAEEFFDGSLFGIAHATKDLYGLRGDVFSDLRRQVLGHGTLLQKGLPGVFQTCGVIHQQPCGLELCGHLVQLELP